ncbi:hypothetical protein NHX12_002529 [Muraenolepis orangiensis]|uniref:Cadherin domain-containing protein n=1 Tax=Muraenolepis orangiensis TaxID=630683 RepID=A0A9Q0DZM7_9TELE|nr:hypothetical protein NHX12_002529 [Muraenolepis orangiensis]
MDPRSPQRLLLLLLFLHPATATSGWGGCLEAQDVSAAVRENSPAGELIAQFSPDVTRQGTRWSLAGRDAHWFFLEESALRLNTAPGKTLDREVQGPFLMAELACYEDDILQTVYRIMVEILNENEHVPVFPENTIQSVVISELTPADTVVFTVRAVDGDGDRLIYSIDEESPDAEYLKLNLPNSGNIMLAKPLDYETKSLLTVTVHASEVSTAEHFHTSTTVSITVADGDDQYPQFLPCTLLFRDPFDRICVSPVYTVNVTEGQKDIVLDLCPGPIYAVDGDRGLSALISYAILSGGDDGRFQMDKQTGEVRLMQAVTDRLTNPTLHLRVMAYQDDDPRKYSVASVLVFVHAVNRFQPSFEQREYRAFVNAAQGPAALLTTYANEGSNPMIFFTFCPASNHTALYQITQEGLVIARPNQLRAKQRHTLLVAAVDQESGDAAYTEERISGCAVGSSMVLCFLCMVPLGCGLYLMSWLKRRHRGHRERGFVAQGKHPNVSLKWYQMISHHSPMAQSEEMAFSDGGLGTYNPSFSLQDKAPVVYIHKDLPTCQAPTSMSPIVVRDTTSRTTSTTPSPGGAWADPDPPTITSPCLMMPKEDHSPTLLVATSEFQHTPSNICLDPVDLPAPPSPCGDPVPAVPCQHPSTVEIDLRYARPASATTPEPSYSPVGTAPGPTPPATPPHSPELPAAIQVIPSPHTPRAQAVDLPSASAGLTGAPGGAVGGLDSLSLPSTNSGETQLSHKEGEVEGKDDGFLEDKEGDDGLESDEEERLTVHPVLMTVSDVK